MSVQSPPWVCHRQGGCFELAQAQSPESHVHAQPVVAPSGVRLDTVLLLPAMNTFKDHQNSAAGAGFADNNAACSALVYSFLSASSRPLNESFLFRGDMVVLHEHDRFTTPRLGAFYIVACS